MTQKEKAVLKLKELFPDAAINDNSNYEIDYKTFELVSLIFAHGRSSIVGFSFINNHSTIFEGTYTYATQLIAKKLKRDTCYVAYCDFNSNNNISHVTLSDEFYLLT